MGGLSHLDTFGATILIVDDEESVVRALKKFLERAGYQSVHGTSDSSEVLEICGEVEPDLIICDLHMPGLSGFDVLEMSKALPFLIEPIPIIVLTGEQGHEARLKALRMGASDYIVKPFDMEVVARVKNTLKHRMLSKKIHEQNLLLEDRVRERTAKLKSAQVEIVRRLGLAAEYRDDDTGEHVVRICEYTRVMAEGLGESEREAHRLGLAAKLHDIGKLGIPDSILLKPGKLTDEEFDVIKTHTLIGAQILSGADSKLLQLAELIALSHHEKWNGNGYPHGLKQEEIPLPARLVAVVDVFDAVTSKRPYKKAFPIEEALDLLKKERGKHFDPQMIDLFFSQLDAILRIRAEGTESP